MISAFYIQKTVTRVIQFILIHERRIEMR